MAVQGDDNISLNAMKTLVGASSAALTAEVCQSDNINRWSYYRARRIKAHATTKLVELVNVAPYRLGDFRRYDDNASEPDPYNSIESALNWGPGGGTADFAAFVNLQAMNVKEIAYYDSASYDYIQVDLYSSAANRTAGTPKVHTQKFAISYSSPTILVNHTVDKYGITEFPNSPQLITLTSVPTTYGHVYADTYITNSAGTRKISFDDGYSDFDLHELSNPLVKSTAIQSIPGTGPPVGAWTGQAFIITNPSATLAATVDVDQSLGTTYTFYAHIVALGTVNNYICGVSSITMTLSKSGPFTCYSGSMSHQANTSVSGSLPLGSWTYDDIGLVDASSITYDGNFTLVPY